jgi:hypothetical protein
MQRRSIGGRCGAVAMAVSLSMFSCTDDEGDADGQASPSSRATDAAFCTAWLDMTPHLTENLTAEQDGDNTAVTGRMRDLLSPTTPPTEVAEAADYVLEAVTDAAEGDRASYDLPEMRTSADEILAWTHDNCGFREVEVTYRDYAYVGLPSKTPAEPTSFAGVQAGDEPHLMQIHRLRPGVEGTPEEVLTRARQASIPSQALAEMTEIVAVGAFTDFDDETGHMLIDLTPGSYLVICPIPTGIGRDRVPPEHAQPHFYEGQVGSFTVE